jgi:hypothetical protein
MQKFTESRKFDPVAEWTRQDVGNAARTPADGASLQLDLAQRRIC